MTKPVMKLMDGRTGEMQCKVCSSVHCASIKPHSIGRYYHGSWQCVYGCKLPTKLEPQAYNGWKQAWIGASEPHSA
jgi:hypothetical protein